MDMNIASRYYKYREDEDLAFIAHCTHEQLAPLVSYLTIDRDGKPRLAETLTNNPEFKANKHDFLGLGKPSALSCKHMATRQH